MNVKNLMRLFKTLNSAVEIGGKKISFTLKEGEDLVFERKD